MCFCLFTVVNCFVFQGEDFSSMLLDWWRKTYVLFCSISNLIIKICNVRGSTFILWTIFKRRTSNISEVLLFLSICLFRQIKKVHAGSICLYFTTGKVVLLGFIRCGRGLSATSVACNSHVRCCVCVRRSICSLSDVPPLGVFKYGAVELQRRRRRRMHLPGYPLPFLPRSWG